MVTVTTHLALEVHTANRAGDMTLADNFVFVQSIEVVEVFIADFAIVVFVELVLAKVLQRSESALTVLVGTWEGG